MTTCGRYLVPVVLRRINGDKVRGITVDSGVSYRPFDVLMFHPLHSDATVMFYHVLDRECGFSYIVI